MDYNNPNTVTFEDGLELTNFNWAWDSASYTRDSTNTDVVVKMQLPGGGLEYERTFEIAKPAVWDEPALNTELLKLPEFTGSNPI